jgi:DHA2 family multidrug resistance protein
LWERREALHHTHLTESITPYNPLAEQVFDSLRKLGLDEAQSAAYLAGEITRQGFVLAATEIFWLCGAVLFVLIAVVWLAKPAGKSAR